MSAGMLRRPPGLDRFRLLGALFTDPASALDRIRRDHGAACLLGAGPVKVAVISDPAMLQAMFKTPATAFRWAHRFNVVGLRFFIGRTSMIVSDGPDHDRRRASVQGAFARRRLNSWVPMILTRTDEAIDRLVARAAVDPSGGPVDVYPDGRRLIMSITLHALFGERLADRVDEFGELYERPQRFIEAPAFRQLPHPFPFTARARVRADREAIDRLIDAEVANRRASLEADPLDVLDVIVRSGELTDTEIRDQVRTLIGAGYDTTASALAWLVLRAAGTPGVWARLRHEADDVFGHPPAPASPATAAAVAGLTFAGQVVRESLRLHPAGLIGARLSAVDIDLAGTIVPRSTLIAWSPYLSGRDPAVWSEPLRFDPDRFDLDRNGAMTPDQRAAADQAWIPFGSGPHHCIGFALAQMELTLILARLAQRLTLTTTNSAVPRPVGMIVNRPEGGALVRVADRTPPPGVGT